MSCRCCTFTKLCSRCCSRCAGRGCRVRGNPFDNKPNLTPLLAPCRPELQDPGGIAQGPFDPPPLLDQDQLLTRGLNLGLGELLPRFDHVGSDQRMEHILACGVFGNAGDPLGPVVEPEWNLSHPQSWVERYVA